MNSAKKCLFHEHIGPKISAKIKSYILSRAKLLCSFCHETPCIQQHLALGRRLTCRREILYKLGKGIQIGKSHDFEKLHQVRFVRFLLYRENCAFKYLFILIIIVQLLKFVCFSQTSISYQYLLKYITVLWQYLMESNPNGNFQLSVAYLGSLATLTSH